MRLDRDRLLNILDARAAIERHRPKHQADFDANELVRVWCLRHAQIIGESAANVSHSESQSRPRPTTGSAAVACACTGRLTPGRRVTARVKPMPDPNDITGAPNPPYAAKP
jgi:hypothetical protein